ncbi:MAG: DNA alkylation repair protein [Saprospiraceae bacterium]|nr:DNA alkylation repair protein [Saprospiraceae bacterium]
MDRRINKLFYSLKNDLNENRDDVRAEGMAAYMRNQFVYYGISSPQRKEICKKYFTAKLIDDQKSIQEFVELCWSQDEREWKYIALDFSLKYLQSSMLDLIPYYEKLVTDQPWWDTVDSIAPNMLGRLLKDDSNLRRLKQREWIDSDNFWIQRTAIILQLMYKKETDFDILKELILRRANSKEFFVQKAIGWSLRQYSKINPKAVIHFVDRNTLAPLSRREALKLIKE